MNSVPKLRLADFFLHATWCCVSSEPISWGEIIVKGIVPLSCFVTSLGDACRFEETFLRKFGVQRVIKSNRPQKIMKTSTAAIFLATAFAMALVPSADAKLTRGNVPSPSNNMDMEDLELDSIIRGNVPSKPNNMAMEERELQSSTDNKKKSGKKSGKKCRKF
jgi:hypothetical protein